MRKVAYGFGVLLMAVVLLTGCGNSEKVLTCTISHNDSGVVLDSEEKYTFNGTQISKVDLKMTYHFEDSILAELTEEELTQMIDEIASNLNDSFETDEGTTINVEKNKDNLVFTLVGDPAKMSEENKTTWIGDSKSYSYDMSKKNLEDQGYTCK